MSDIFTPYETGLTRLLERLGSDHPRYTEALVYQHRLQENITGAQRYGDTETRRAERAEIVEAVNRLALEAIGISYNDLCQTYNTPPRQSSSQHPRRSPFVRVKSTAPVYQITRDGTRRWIPDGDTLKSLGNWDQIEILASLVELKHFPPARPVPSVIHGERPWLVRIHSEPETYLIDEKGNRHYIPDGATLGVLVRESGDVDLLVDWEELERFPRSDPVPSVLSEQSRVSESELSSPLQHQQQTLASHTLSVDSSAPALDEVTNPSAHPTQGRQSGRVFISHSSKDREFVVRLAKDLKAAGHAVWYADWEIKVGDSIVQRINEGLAESSYLLVVLSPNSANSRWVQQELNTALMEQLSRRRITVLPVLLRDCKIPLLLQDIKYADFRADYDAGLRELLEVLEKASSPAQPALIERVSWKQRFLKILRDPVWQAIAAVVAILTLLITAWAVFRPDETTPVTTPAMNVTNEVTTNSDISSDEPLSSPVPLPTPEPFEIQYITFNPPPPATAENVKIFACTRGYSGVGITLRVSINSAPDGSDTGEWQVLKELGVPCFNQTDAPIWNTRESKAGTYLVKVEAKGSDDPEWEKPAVLTATYTLLEKATPEIK